MLLRALLALAAAAAVLSSPLSRRREYAVKDSFNVPRAWSSLGPAPADHIVNLNIGLKQSKFKELERHLYEVSDPKHHRYGQHLTEPEVNELVKPSQEADRLVHEWLLEHGIERAQLSYNAAGDWISVSLPVSGVESLLATNYFVYEHEFGGSTIVRAPEWSLPEYLHEHIDAIQPTNSFLRAAPRSNVEIRSSKVKTPVGGFQGFYPGDLPPPPTSTSFPDVCDINLVTPLCLSTFYGTVNYKVQAAGKNKMALNDFLGELNNRSDVEIYLQMFRPEAAAAAYEFEQISIAGGTLQQTPDNVTQLEDGTGIEGDLDSETMLGIAWPTPLIAYSTGGSPPYLPDAFTPTDTNEPYLVWLQYILAQSDIPGVISSSYDDDEQSVPYSYAVTVCNQMAQLGARGITVLFASGDDGVGASGYCFTNDGTNSSTFLPEFPSTCPYITSVGATQFFDPEEAANQTGFTFPFHSGGGFSSYFPRPWYQEAAVSNYLSSYITGNPEYPYDGLYNPGGRGLPDIAAQGRNFSTVWNGTVVPVGGTSAATPTAAGILALVNDALIAAGRPTLGFINPWLYGGGYKAFNDILIGGSAGCDTSGFPAEEGWDAVTGWGTPYFPDILKLLGLECDW